MIGLYELLDPTTYRIESPWPLFLCSDKPPINWKSIILCIPSLLLLDSIFVLAGKLHVSIIDSPLRLETNATNDKRQTVDAHLASA